MYSVHKSRAIDGCFEGYFQFTSWPVQVSRLFSSIRAVPLQIKLSILSETNCADMVRKVRFSMRIGTFSNGVPSNIRYISNICMERKHSSEKFRSRS